ncbi:lipopolysaccharide biosynthesis protein [uncultured Draconibacterium sp.]|uniref:lipopolysaccharide biosynthesis protein n=1 Tax=uncultured Draconibacterium sp. TaxID=1573823 RepID=UPI0029C6CCCE|nr:lipopolysaccharide biosynthesis protein [uncultured Draconibacterium sp.]
MSSTLKEKTVNGFKWSFLDNVGKVGGQFVIGIILTRLLSPADFGLVGMLTIFIVIGQTLTNSGYGQALVQKKDADLTDFSTVFYFNILASTLIYAVIFVCSPYIARFYNEPQLVLLTKVICLNFVINAFGLIQIIYLDKALDFKAPSIIGIVSVFVAGGVSIVLAYNDFGVWALVVNTVLRSLITTLLLWFVSKWRPIFVFSKKSLASMFSYGSKILLAGLLQSVFRNIYYLIIGRIFDAKSLGYYTRAAQFTELPVSTLTIVIQKVTFPVFSSIQNDTEKVIGGYNKVYRLLASAAFPLMVFIYISSGPLIEIVLGEKWLPVVPYLKLLCLYSWVYVFFTVNNQIITIKGRSDFYLHIQIIDKILIVLAIALTYKKGISALILGHMVATVITFFVGCYYMKKVIAISLLSQLKNIFPFFVASLFMLATGILISKIISGNIQYLLACIIIAPVVYMFGLWIFKVKELNIGFNWAKTTIKKFKNKK